MSAWEFGAVIRVNPETQPQVPQPDDRRWVVIVRANTHAKRPWTFQFIGPGYAGTNEIVHFDSSYGFCLAEPGE